MNSDKLSTAIQWDIVCNWVMTGYELWKNYHRNTPDKSMGTPIPVSANSSKCGGSCACWLGNHRLCVIAFSVSYANLDLHFPHSWLCWHMWRSSRRAQSARSIDLPSVTVTVPTKMSAPTFPFMLACPCTKMDIIFRVLEISSNSSHCQWVIPV